MIDVLCSYQGHLIGMSLTTVVYEQGWRNATETIVKELSVKAEQKTEEGGDQEKKT